MPSTSHNNLHNQTIPVAVIIPVYNEHEKLAATVAAIRASLDATAHSITIVASSAQDTTIPVANSLGCDVLISSTQGRGNQMKFGAQSIGNNQYYWFIHADCWPDSDVGNQLAKRQPQAAVLRFTIRAKGLRYRIVELGASIRNDLFNGTPYGDQSLWIRRDIYWELDGFDNLPLFEDVVLNRRIDAQYDLERWPQAIQTDARKWANDGATRRTLTNWMTRGLFERGVATEQLVEFYRLGQRPFHQQLRHAIRLLTG